LRTFSRDFAEFVDMRLGHSQIQSQDSFLPLKLEKSLKAYEKQRAFPGRKIGFWICIRIGRHVRRLDRDDACRIARRVFYVWLSSATEPFPLITDDENIIAQGLPPFVICAFLG
jgi:hypothetical protein